MERSVRVLDGAILVIDAVAGVQAQTKTVWRQVCKQNIPAIAFINKMDRDGADFKRSVGSLREKLGVNALPIQIPIGQEDTFSGVIDLVTMSKIVWPSVPNSRTPFRPMISILRDDENNFNEAIEARRVMMENIAEHDDHFFELFVTEDSGVADVEIIAALRRLCLTNVAVPIICGSSLKGKGIEPLLNSIVSFLPSPVDRQPQVAVSKNSMEPVRIDVHTKDLFALVFKIMHDKDRGPIVFVRVFSGFISQKQVIKNSTRDTKERVHQLFRIHADEMESVDKILPGQVACIVGLKGTKTGDTLVLEKGPLSNFVLDGLSIPKPVYSLSIEPTESSKSKDLDEALKILSLEDPSLEIEYNSESGQVLLNGIGELHLEIVCDKLKRDFGLEVYTGKSYVAFRETIISTDSGPIIKSMTYDKMIGNKRLFAHIELEIKSSDWNTNPTVEIASEVKGKLNAEEITSLIDGIQNAYVRGPLGYPIVGIDIKVARLEKDHDSTPGAIRACAAIMIDNLLKSNLKEILEPIMSAEIDVPTQFVGDVISDIAVSRRGSITEVFSSGFRSVILAEVPLATMLGYATVIRSLTQGEGVFSLEYSKHAVVDIASMTSVP